MSKKTKQTGIKKVLTGIIVSLFYLISCSSEGGTSPSPSPTPSDQGTMDHIKALKLEEVTETNITVSWDLLRNEDGAVDYTIDYTVYAETNDGNRFTKDPSTEREYTLLAGSEKEVLPEDGSGNRTGDITVSNLTENTPNRIVVEAMDTSGNSSRSHILVYTASVLTDTAITPIATVDDNDQVTVTWTAKEGAQGYAIKVVSNVKVENLLGKSIKNGVIVVVCSPGILLCEGDQFAKEEGGRLTYDLPQAGSRYEQVVVVPFNMRDLIGLQATDEQGQVPFTAGVLELLTEEDPLEAPPLKDRLDGAVPISIYDTPSAPSELKVDFSRGVFANIGNKLYAIGYPLIYESGGSNENVYYYRYRVGEGDWGTYAEITDEAVIDLQVNNRSDAVAIKAGYGEEYHVEVIASSTGGFVSDPVTLDFTYKSFPEPFPQSDLEVVTNHRSLTVTWPEVAEVNGSTVSSYIVLLKDGPYRSPVQSRNTSEKNVVFDGLSNNQPYYITVIPNGEDTGTLFTALSLDITNALTEGSDAERILTTYTGAPVPYTPQGYPEAVVDLTVVPGDNLATVTWEAPATGSPATGYVVEYLKGVTTPISNIDSGGAAADAELSELSWDGAVSNWVSADDTGSYSYEVSGLDVNSAINVFRVRAVHVDGSSTPWPGAYRYYALGTEPSRAPKSVENLRFFDHSDTSFTVRWTKPDDPGQNRNKEAAQLDGYLVSWGTDAQVYGQSYMISNTNTLFYEITGLTPGTQYYVKVEAKNDNTEGYIYSEGKTGDTYTIKPPGEVDESTITYSGHTTNGFTVSWDAVDAGFGTGGAASVTYLIDWKDRGGDWNSVTRSVYSTTTETLTGLTPGTAYQVRVTATNGFRGASPTEGGETWTFSLPTSKVAGLMVNTPTYSNITHTGGFTVEWTAPTDTGISSSNGDAATITNYEIAYAEVVDDFVGEYTSVEHGGVGTRYVFTDLKPNSKYQILVRAQTVIGTGPATNVSGWVPSPPGKVNPDSIEFTNATVNTIDITWAAPQAGRAGGSSSTNATTRYKVVISNDNGEWYTEVTNNYEGTNIIASNLSNSTTYRAQITAMNDWGAADLSISSDTGTTPKEPPRYPSPVRDLTVASFTTNQVVLTWSALAPSEMGIIDGTNALFSRYVVKYKKSADSDFIEIDENSTGIRLTAALTATTATVIGLSPGTYTFLVAAVNSGDEVTPDAESFTVDKTIILRPENLKQGQCDKAISADLAWEASTGATSYQVYRDNEEVATNITTTFYTDTGLDPATSYTYTVRACKDAVCSDDSDSLTITTTIIEKNFKNIIEAGRVPESLTDYDQMSREIFSGYNGNTDLEVRYLKPGGSGEGISFADAAGNLKTVLDGIRDAGNNKVYAVLLTGGNYTNGVSIAMKNNVAIIGGVDECLDSSETVTALDGENKYRVFNNSGLNKTALLYGVTVTKGSSDKGGGMHNKDNSSPRLVGVTFSGNTATVEGGGMYNQNSSSPSLERVTFSGNRANQDGGGMYNWISSPSLKGVTFSNNTATDDGGGMFNWISSSPTLERVTFSGNRAYGIGGGMVNWENSSPSLVGVTFSGNRADEQGGGMYNTANSSPTLEGVTFFENSAKQAGGVYQGSGNPLIINGIFWGNTASPGPQIYINNVGNIQGNIRIYNSIVQEGTGTLVSGTTYTDVNQGGFGSGNSYGDPATGPVVIYFTNIIAADPRLFPLDDYGGSVLIHPISRTSPAVNQGLYVKKKWDNGQSKYIYYYSADSTAWYTQPDLSGDVFAEPTDAVDLTATDATGYTLTDRPDLGAYEARAEGGPVEETIPSPENFRQLTQTCAKATSVALAWDAVTGATSYEVYQDGAKITNITTTSYTDAGLIPGKTYTYTVRACKVDNCSDDSDSRSITTIALNNSFKSIIEAAEIPADLTGYDQMSREIFSRDRYTPNTCVVAKYLKPGANGGGSSFADAAGNLRSVLNEITGSDNRVYAVLLTGGTYQAGGTMAMENHVAIIGGLNEDLGSSETVTVLDGEGNYRVFNNNGLNKTALLYGVTIANGKADKGGGMNNSSSSPTLVGVTFSGNTATSYGGGMYNESSSPTLVGVTFSGNTATSYSGGGMRNEYSSPSLDGVTFSRNTAPEGGGMDNFNSSPSLVGVTFSSNRATGDGGGIHNQRSSPSLVGVTFSENRSGNNGGGMYNEVSSSPILIGVTFSGNTASRGGGIYNRESTLTLVGVTFSGNKATIGGGGIRDFYGVSVVIVNSILWGNTAPSGPQFQGEVDIYDSIVEGGTGTLVNVVHIIDQNPKLLPLADNGGSVLTHAIATDSPAVNQGLYVKRKNRTFYYSSDNTNWHTGPDFKTEAAPPTDAEYLTDATGYTPTDKPDIGAYEVR